MVSQASTNLSPAVIALISGGSAVVGAAVVAISTLITTWLTERSQEHRHRTELAFHAAVEQYKADQAMVLEMAARRPHDTFKQYPLDDYLIAMAKLVDLIGRNLSDDQLAAALKARQDTLSRAREQWLSPREAGAAAIQESERRARRDQGST